MVINKLRKAFSKSPSKSSEGFMSYEFIRCSDSIKKLRKFEQDAFDLIQKLKAEEKIVRAPFVFRDIEKFEGFSIPKGEKCFVFTVLTKGPISPSVESKINKIGFMKASENKLGK